MLRLVLDWFSENRDVEHPLSMDAASRWYSEAILTSAFLPRHRGDKYAEGFTHADGAIGHFEIGTAGQADLKLLPDATIFKITEAKMFSGLSKGTTRAPTYNQAARNVACIAETLRLARRTPSDMQAIGFFVVAPERQIDGGVFTKQMDRSSITSSLIGSRTRSSRSWNGSKFAAFRGKVSLRSSPNRNLISARQLASFTNSASGSTVWCPRLADPVTRARDWGIAAGFPIATLAFRKPKFFGLA